VSTEPSTPPSPDPFQLGTKVSHWRDPLRREGVITEVHPYGEFQVLWQGFKRPETMLRYDLEPR